MTQQASGFTTDYTDPKTGVSLVDAWAQIRQVNYAPYQSVLIVVDIYLDQASYPSMQPVFYNVLPSISKSDAAWDTYFDPEVMDEAGHNIQKQALAYVEANL